MSFTSLTKSTALGLALTLASSGFAQSSASQSEDPSRSQSSSSPSATEASKDELRVSQEDAQQEVTDVNKASKIIGMPVQNKQNQRVGKVHDLVLDTKSGKIAYAVISSGGVLGAGDRLVAVPITALTPQQGQKGFLINAEKERLSQAPGFSEKDWPKINAAEESTVGLSPTGRTSSQSGQSDPSQSSSADPSSSASSSPTPSPTPDSSASAPSSSSSSEPSASSPSASPDSSSSSSTTTPPEKQP